MDESWQRRSTDKPQTEGAHLQNVQADIAKLIKDVDALKSIFALIPEIQIALREIQVLFCDMAEADPKQGLPFEVQQRIKKRWGFLGVQEAQKKGILLWMVGVSSLATGTVISGLIMYAITRH